jgi:hypothetical protein
VHFLVETPLGATIPTISLDPLYTAEKAVSAIVVRESDPRLTRALKTEAESYAEGIRGNPMIYSHRTFLSGGKGVSTPPMMGVGARWKIEVPKDGRFEVVLKVATHEESAVRAIAIDGRPVFGDHFLVRFPNTGGFGADPAEWKHYAVAGPDGKPLSLELKAGPHVIEIVSVEGLLNLDCLWFAPP